MKCLRCGQDTPRLTPDQVHCIRCAAEVAALVTPRREGFVAPWRRRLIAKDMTNYGPSL
jgi:hypothetical protein